jgi:GDPmannose 4,6-dehydratase
MLLNINPSPGAYYNIGGTYTCKVGETLNYLLSKSTVKDIEVVIDSSRLRPIDADLQIPDTTKFRELTGWKPEITFDKTMDDLLDYWRERINKGRKFLNR